MTVQQEEEGQVTLSVPPPPSRITSGIEVIRFVGHLGGGRGAWPNSPRTPGTWARALIHPTAVHHVPRSCPHALLSQLHGPSRPCPCYLSPLSLLHLISILVSSLHL